MPKLNNWSVIFRGSPYDPPEACTPVLAGKVSGHPNPRFYDGKEIETSAIMGLSGTKVLTVSGSVYELLEVDPQYEEKFPRALERLLKTYPQLEKQL